MVEVKDLSKYLYAKEPEEPDAVPPPPSPTRSECTQTTATSLPALIGAALAFLVKLAVIFLVAGLIENSAARTRFRFASRATWAGFGIATLAFAFYLVGL